jgi:hypothetical protein
MTAVGFNTMDEMLYDLLIDFVAQVGIVLEYTAHGLGFPNLKEEILLRKGCILKT